MKTNKIKSPIMYRSIWGSCSGNYYIETNQRPGSRARKLAEKLGVTLTSKAWIPQWSDGTSDALVYEIIAPFNGTDKERKEAINSVARKI